MKKLLFLSGIIAIGGSFYYYFKRQLDLAMDFTYDIKDIKFSNLTKKGTEIRLIFEFTNRSNFKVEVVDYSFNFKYNQISIGSTKSHKPTTIQPNETVTINANGYLSFSNLKASITPFLNDFFQKKPIDLEIYGYIQIEFMGIRRTIDLEGKNVVFSENLLADLNIESQFDSVRNKINDLLGKVNF